MNQPTIATQLEITEFVRKNSEWVFVDSSLQAKYIFTDFEDAMHLITELVGMISELDHHPYWSNEYNKVTFILRTHSCDNKVTSLDIALATHISDLVKSKAG